VKRVASSVKSRALALVTGVVLVTIAAPSMAQINFESPPTFRAAKVVPEELREGPYHRIADSVKNDGFMNHYTVHSPFGTFQADSHDELEIRVAEVNGIARMTEFSEGEQFVKGVGKAGRDILKGTKRLVTDPVETAKTTKKGVEQIFASAKRSLEQDPSELTREDIKQAAVDAIGYSRAKREYAAAFGVDPYSSNEVLQHHLDRLAGAAFAGDFSAGTALGLIGSGVGTTLSALGQLESLKEQVRDHSPEELRAINWKKLRKMGIEKSVIELFLANYVFSPTYQTAYVDSLEKIENAADRRELVKVAVLAKDEDQALFRVSQARMYANYHESVAPIRGFVSVSELVVVAARTADGALVVHVPSDYVSLSSNLAAFFKVARTGLEGVPGVERKELWLAGGMSPRARKWVEESGWTIHTNFRGSRSKSQNESQQGD
jgi:hypothetical protein